MKSISFLKRITIPKEWPQLKVDTIFHFDPLRTRMYIRGISAKLYLSKNLLKITNQIAPIPFHGKTVLFKWNSKNHITASLSKYVSFTYVKQNILPKVADFQGLKIKCYDMTVYNLRLLIWLQVAYCCVYAIQLPIPFEFEGNPYGKISWDWMFCCKLVR